MHRDKNKTSESYDKIADWFDKTRTRNLMERPYLEALTTNLKDGSAILDLGCGTGEPILRFLSGLGYRITGVDSSKAMLDKGQQRFPDVKFVLEDMRDIDFVECFDAIIAWHSLFHLPPNDQRTIFEVFARHLNSGGWLLFTSGTEEGEHWSDNNGEELYHASLNTEEYARLLTEHHFRSIKHVPNDPKCGGATIWLARYQSK